MQGVELRTRGAQPVLRGYAAVFNKRSQDLGGFVEVIKPGAFRRSLASGDDVFALAHHDTGRVLARRSAGTLKISEDSIGLAVEIELGKTSHARDITEDVRTGNINSMSFGFRTRSDKIVKDAHGIRIRELHDVDLFEVSPVAFPAYVDTSIALRSLNFGAIDKSQLRTRLYRARLRLMLLKV